MILVGIPYHKQKRYSLNHLFDWLEKAELPYSQVILREHRGPYGETDAVKRQREFFRELAVDMDATHLFFVGADTIPPLDALPRLLKHNKDYVSGIYNARQGSSEAAMFWPKQKARGLIEVDGSGSDCLLLSRDAFSSFSYNDWEITDDDYPLCDLLKRLGLKLYVDTDVKCRHYNSKTEYSGG